jgi:hypothetical protein
MEHSSELVKFAGGLPIKPDDLEAGLQNVQSSIQGGTGGMPFLRLLKAGYFVYGAENIEVEPGSEWAINPYSLMHGFACWAPGELLDERMVPFTQAPPNKAELPDLGQSWDQQVAMQLACTTGEDAGVNVLYKGTSTGLRNAAKELINAIISQLQTDKELIVPVVELETDSYNHKQYGQIFYPILTIKKWITIDGDAAEVSEVADQSEADPAPEESAEAETPKADTPPPRRRRGKTSKAKADVEEKPQSSNRRRRRRAS